MTVAMAAPATPMSKTKMKIGSRTRFRTAPMARVHMPVFGNPWALIKPFIPVEKWRGGTEEVDGEIFLSVSERVLSRAEEPQDRIPEGEADHKQYQGGTHQKGHGLAENQLARFSSFAPLAMEKRGTHPVENRLVKAAIRVVRGKASPMPVSAVLPTTGRWPI